MWLEGKCRLYERFLKGSIYCWQNVVRDQFFYRGLEKYLAVIVGLDASSSYECV